MHHSNGSSLIGRLDRVRRIPYPSSNFYLNFCRTSNSTNRKAKNFRIFIRLVPGSIVITDFGLLHRFIRTYP
ncbi:hypothetical protein BDV27DRAFT_125212 [Aspergillus caelatus]|uniref:Uncharacterized protein n=1 Tax=Aspergillus caelatus TaxID=61420 RepID=A0A5N7ACY8_9EURO|nr:uncharacterized protein BDV27DRAFT_125212 [Aspergillus caelatus]KAE8366500.1 hypothetical protein BDV27DRAFT_125212 [Aspergillus caelatus]